MTPHWPGLPMRAQGRRPRVSVAGIDVPDHHSQLEELLGHVRQCEKWARLDDRIDLSWRLDGRR